MEADYANRVASARVEADLLGHTSHGLDLLARYVDEIGTPRMRGSGVPEVIADNGSSLLWDGGMLAGPALVTLAIDAGLERLPQYGLVTVVVRHCHHTASLAAYLQRATDQGALILLASSSPGGTAVAPFRGRKGTYSTDPLACGIPTSGDPILIDLSLASVSANVCRQFADRGEKLPGQWLLDSNGQPTDDPRVVRGGGGSIMPLGGTDLGYKGFALALILEALTSGLAGHGRSNKPPQGENTVFVMLIDPDRYGGAAHLRHEMGWLVERCREASIPGAAPVRIPGERALATRRDAFANGLHVPEPIVEDLTARARANGLAFPPEFASAG
jgi:LDH2 family malate/lactate/ureidoglycolate dehydrogenase